MKTSWSVYTVRPYLKHTCTHAHTHSRKERGLEMKTPSLRGKLAQGIQSTTIDYHLTRSYETTVLHDATTLVTGFHDTGNNNDTVGDRERERTK